MTELVWLAWYLIGAVCGQEDCVYNEQFDAHSVWFDESCISAGIGYEQFGCGYYHNYGTRQGDGNGNGYGYYDYQEF